ncbi:metallophosphoesterase family protein [Sediminispirochaeta smaragdinae]|jgi:predicted phosphodiesterase|uniref:Metallophosphoesterase n=1 Tax=Sediminispirochaeta smaragdinae (strain DSM 11293 / JCM 15392 / SEBR 4228) TaxID=573413 RepID=E1RBA8_SEDSS|nr:metallophosphoesterase family protein [Sediminispirochaeta smaragdinae]ADK79638.1 metallophosphoesterase [Sediminispirochaeta smaragdinae DSM 11293]
MKILVLSDIHGNREALETVLSECEGEYQQIWCLGDIVGYGPDPNDCIEILAGKEVVAVMGNHDLGAGRGEKWDLFSPVARTMIEWTAERLSGQSRHYLSKLPEIAYRDGYTLVHGSPAGPVWRYILDGHSAAEAFSLMDTPACLYGHTHVPALFSLSKRALRYHQPRYGKRMRPPGQMWLANPGSCGIPRDGDGRAAFILLDTESGFFTFRRIVYPKNRTVEKLKRLGAPYQLIQLLQSDI